MSTLQRVSLATACVAVLVVAFLLLRPAGDDSDPSGPERATPTATADSAPTTPDLPPAAGPEAPPDAEAPLLTADGEPTVIEVSRGEEVRLRARSAEAEELHVHGYDIFREVGAGDTVALAFPAELEGIFEIEFERSETMIGELQVNP